MSLRNFLQGVVFFFVVDFMCMRFFSFPSLALVFFLFICAFRTSLTSSLLISSFVILLFLDAISGVTFGFLSSLFALIIGFGFVIQKRVIFDQNSLLIDTLFGIFACLTFLVLCGLLVPLSGTSQEFFWLALEAPLVGLLTVLLFKPLPTRFFVTL